MGAVTFLSSAPAAAPESTFVLPDGSRESTSDLKGEVTLVNFWTTCCVACVAEMAKIASTYQEYQARGYGTMAVGRAWGDVQLTPTSFLVNKQGMIVERHIGGPDFAELHRLIVKLLAET